MKCRSDSLDGGEDPRAPTAAADTVDAESSEPTKKQRTGEPSAGSTSSPRAPTAAADTVDVESSEPTKKQRTEEPSAGSTSSSPRAPPPPAREEPAARVPDLGEDLVFEVLVRAEARTLASAACVSRAWRDLARDERLWEAACVREWDGLGFSEHMLRRVVLSLGGFRRLHERYIRPLQQQRRGAGVRRRQVVPVRIARDQVQVSLSLLSTSFFQNMPNAPPPPAPKKKDKDNDKNGGGKCG